MKYLLLVSDDGPPGAVANDVAGSPERHLQARSELQEDGVWCGGELLQPAISVTGLRLSEGRVVLHDGPSMGPGDRLVSYYLVDCDDLDHAIVVSARLPIGEHGSVEIHPVHEPRAATTGPAP